MSESDHEKLPLTEGDVESKTSKCNWPKCNWPKCNKPPICKFDPLTCALPAALAFMICILFIVYVAKLIIYEVNYEPPDIPIEIKNFTIICDTWNGNNHPCLWNDKYCTVKDPCILSCKDYIKFSAGCFHSDCNERGRYDWCNDRPFGGQGGFLSYN